MGYDLRKGVSDSIHKQEHWYGDNEQARLPWKLYLSRYKMNQMIALKKCCEIFGYQELLGVAI